MNNIEFESEEHKQRFYDFVSFFQNNNQDEEILESESQSPFVETVSEEISTDIVMDLKKGIYNLFVNLINNQIVQLGPEGAVRSSIDYLEEIIYNFKQAIDKDQE